VICHCSIAALLSPHAEEPFRDYLIGGYLMRRCLNLAVITVVLLVASGCASVPLDTPKNASVAITNTEDGREAQLVKQWLGGRENVNGFYPLSGGFDAFGARLSLMTVAESSIDAQYFLMSPDNAGLVFAKTMLDAAERGVRVRFLLDDIFTTVDDIDLAMLDNHPNIEVRIFNPISRKGIYAFNYVGHFSLLNRRMHNKSFTVDSQISVVGGRNIADEYYQLESTGEFIDFDMLAVGPIVKKVSAEFDTYWNHKLAVPMSVLYKEDDQAKIAKARETLEQQMADAGDTIYGDAVNTPLMQQFVNQEVAPYIATAKLISDSPEKLLQPVSDDQKIVAGELREALLAAEKEIYIFTPYLIPRKGGMELIRELRAKGIRIVVLTNSLATDNHTSVFSAYQKYRKDMLRAGVELWEARADAAKIVNDDGTSMLDKLTLHTKGMLIDGNRVFVGSLNLDPRSIDINTEMGLLIDSPEIGALLRGNSEQNIPLMAYRLQLDDNDKITWHATIDGKEVVETKEPQTTAWKRFSAWFLRIAPENQL
jgi:putative cardiolipin synthase